MSLNISGKIKTIQSKVSVGRNGTWVKQNFVIETDGQYPKTVCFVAWDDKTEALDRLSTGDPVTVHF